jgi:cyclopropane-fatty-acyl-phospholipid synthase
MLDALLEKDLLPDWLIRAGIRRLLARRLREEAGRYDPAAYAADLARRPIAENTPAANRQHYEVPTAFYQLCLGPRLKYSGCLYPTGAETLAEAEEAMLALYVERGRLADGQDILELGCGWGSLSLYLAARFPRARITGVSNSRTQKEHIDAAARERGLTNLRIVTADLNDFAPPGGPYDRIVSVEMLEHMKNYPRLLERIAGWLRPEGRLFVHIFTHRRLAYHFEDGGESDWLARYFFTGGQMPAHDLLARCAGPLRLEEEWIVNGLHYQRTARDWLRRLDERRDQARPLLAATYGPDQARRWWVYWRVFFMSCEELWGFRGGEEWIVSHYRFAPRRTSAGT